VGAIIIIIIISSSSSSTVKKRTRTDLEIIASKHLLISAGCHFCRLFKKRTLLSNLACCQTPVYAIS